MTKWRPALVNQNLFKKVNSSLNRQKDEKGRKECSRHMGHSKKATEGLEREDETQVIFERESLRTF